MKRFKRAVYFQCRKNSPKSPLRKFPNFGMRRKKEEARSSPNWEVIIEQKGNERKSSTPPPIPPRIQPSAPPQEFPENWYPPKPLPFYAPHSPQLYQHQQDNCGSLASPYRYCVTDQNGFENEFLSRNNLTDKSPMRDPLSLSVNNSQVASCLGIGCYNIVLTDSVTSARSLSCQNFAHTAPAIRQDTRNSIASGSCSELISSYTVLPPLPSPGFHVNDVAIVPSTCFKTTKPPLPSPRESLKTSNLVNTNEGRTLSKAKSDLSLHLPVKKFSLHTNGHYSVGKVGIRAAEDIEEYGAPPSDQLRVITVAPHDITPRAQCTRLLTEN
ncbi:hypothetical protein Trydic_g7270 [Trypoxylus dichotomus]